MNTKRILASVLTSERTPIVLTIVGCTGVVATAVMAARAAPKAERVLAELRADRLVDHIPVVDVVKYTWRYYSPAVGVGVITIASILAINKVYDYNALMLSAGATLATNTLKEYQQHVLEEVGPEKESKIRDRIAKDTIRYSSTEPISDLIVVHDGESVILDTLSGRYFKASVEKLRAIENDINRTIISDFSASLNDLYYGIGLEPIDVGDILGFNVDNMVNFHFSAQLNEQKKPVVVLGYINMPVHNFSKCM